MPVGEIGEDLLGESAVDLAGLEDGTDGTGIGEALPDEEAVAACPMIDGDKPHGALLLLPKSQGTAR